MTAYGLGRPKRRALMKPILVVGLMFICLAGRAQDASIVVVKHLASTPYFAFGGVGYAGVTSQGETDFHLLMSKSRMVALQSFEKLFETGNGESKAYALAGIRELDPAEFDQLMTSLPRSNQGIATMAGCIVERRSLIDVATELKLGKYDFWIRRPQTRPQDSRLQNPVGGGYLVRR